MPTRDEFNEFAEYLRERAKLLTVLLRHDHDGRAEWDAWLLDHIGDELAWEAECLGVSNAEEMHTKRSELLVHYRYKLKFIKEQNTKMLQSAAAFEVRDHNGEVGL
jgi:hypothetical protein